MGVEVPHGMTPLPAPFHPLPVHHIIGVAFVVPFQHLGVQEMTLKRFFKPVQVGACTSHPKSDFFSVTPPAASRIERV